MVAHDQVQHMSQEGENDKPDQEDTVRASHGSQRTGHVTLGGRLL